MYDASYTYVWSRDLIHIHPQDPIIPSFDLSSFYVNVEESFCQNQFYVYIHIIPNTDIKPLTEYRSASYSHV